MRNLNKILGLAVAFIVTLTMPAAAVPPPSGLPVSYTVRADHYAEDVCAIIAKEARRRALPDVFLARLIWKESRFNRGAISPKGAQGIAQFMPGTAKERGLANPFEPAAALPASASLLSDLRDSLGNVGLAAAAYNAGHNRVRTWLDGRGSLPTETLDYVVSITGRPASDWTAADIRHEIPAIGKGSDFATDCVALASRPVKLARSPVNQINQDDWQPWGVQLAAARSESMALASYQRLRTRHANVLSGVKPLVVRKRNPAMGRRQIVNVRIGAKSRAEAERFCAKLRSGGGACTVLRN